MVSKAANDPQAIQEQYRTSANLEARIRLHQLFSTNPYGWTRWVFDQLEAPTQAQVLEIGCGPASLWVDNGDRIPSGWQITLTDQSNGMIEQAQATLANIAHEFYFKQADVQVLPLADATFDVVIANHMLYHVPDRPRALAEIQRVLKPSGRLYAATNGQSHMHELRALIQQFDPRLDYRALSPPDRFFSLENGKSQLDPWFTAIELRRYEDSLVVTDVKTVVDYVFSMTSFTGTEYSDPAAARQAFTTYTQAQMQAQGDVFQIQKATGLFIGQKEIG
jgi:SAM-dependent methyltransferase